MHEKIKVTFIPSKRSGVFEKGITIWEAAQVLNVHGIESYCSGMGTCGKCKVWIRQGDFPITVFDEKYLSQNELEIGIRLACQAKIKTTAIIEIIEKEDTDILTTGIERPIELLPEIQKLFVQIKKPELSKNPFDLNDLLEAANLNPVRIKVPLKLLQDLPTKIRQYNYSGTLVLYDDYLIDLEPEDTRNKLYGVAVDIGTTTIVAKLLDLVTGTVLGIDARLNNQRRYGEDVISRIQYSNSKAHGLKEQQTAVIKVLNDMIGALIKESGISHKQVYQIVVVGNTVMSHLFLGVSPKYLAELPYVPVFQGPYIINAEELLINVHPQAVVYIFPNIGRYVGGDTVGVLLSLVEDMDKTWLAVDIGTNGEIVLCHRGKLWCCSTAAGPAFEGAHIEQGMRAAKGAIERVIIDENDIAVKTIGNKKPVGICGSGLIDAVGTLLQLDIIDDTGKIKSDNELPSKLYSPFRKRIKRKNSERKIVLARNPQKDIYLSQKDIRQIQLAKGAIATGIDILLDKAGVTFDDLDHLYLAGAFGQYIRKDMVKIIGLLPNIADDKIFFIGNAAYSGAEKALLNKKSKKLAESLAIETEYIEISTDTEFQMRFADNMLFGQAT